MCYEPSAADRQIDRQTDRQIDQWTDKAAYRIMCTQLKTSCWQIVGFVICSRVFLTSSSKMNRFVCSPSCLLNIYLVAAPVNASSVKVDWIKSEFGDKSWYKSSSKLSWSSILMSKIVYRHERPWGKLGAKQSKAKTVNKRTYDRNGAEQVKELEVIEGCVEKKTCQICCSSC